MDPETRTYENDDGGTTVVVDVPPSEDEPSEAIAEAIEEASSDAVEIARIEADKEVTIAAIHAETEQAALEARTESDAQYVEMRERISWLESELTNTQERNRELEARLTPPPSEVTETISEVTETVQPETETDISEMETETSSSTQTEVPEKSEDAAPEVVEEKVTRRRLRFL